MSELLNLMNDIDRHTGSLAIHGEASAKAGLYRDRFLLLFQRLARDHHFSKPAFDTEISHVGSCEVLSKLKPKPTSTLLINFSFIASDSECLCVCQISPIQSLVGQTGRRWVMGVISQLEDGHYYLEDLTASVEISLSNAISLTLLSLSLSLSRFVMTVVILNLTTT